MSSGLFQRALRVCVLAGEVRSKFTSWPALGKTETLSGTRSDRVPTRPLMPHNPYFMFLKEKRYEIKAANPNMHWKEVLCCVGKLWTELPMKEKEAYRDTYTKARTEFQQEVEAWWAGLQQFEKDAYLRFKEQAKKKRWQKTLKNRLKRLGMPAAPHSADRVFILEKLAADSENTVNRTKKSEVFRNIWKTMTDDERKPYQEIAENDFERFKKEQLIWNLKMMREGKGHLIHENNALKSSVVSVKRTKFKA